MRKTEKERFDEKYRIDESGCWIWLGCKVSGNPSRKHGGKWTYGQFSKHRDGWTKLMPAHRAAYELYVGPIGEGLELDHLCRNTLCVNPAHLEPVTHQVNIQRGYALKPKKTHCINGHEMTEANIYIKPATAIRVAHRECRTCRAVQIKAHYARKEVAHG